MVVKLSYSDVPALYAWLKKHLLETIWVSSYVINHLREEIPGLQLYVDRWPDCQAVLLGFDTNSPGVVFEEFFKNRFEVYGLTDQAVTSLIKDSGLVDWSLPVHFDGVPARLLSAFRDLRPLSEGLMLIPFRFSVLTATAEQVKAVPVKEGLKITPIKRNYISRVSSSWWYNGNGAQEYLLSELRRHPSVLLTTVSGMYVGHIMGMNYCKMTSLYVKPQFRGNRFGRVLASQLAQIYFDKGEHAYVFVCDFYNSSLHVYLSLGFELVPNLEILQLVYTPRQV